MMAIIDDDNADVVVLIFFIYVSKVALEPIGDAVGA